MFSNVGVTSRRTRSLGSLLSFWKVPFVFLVMRKASLLSTSIVCCQTKSIHWYGFRDLYVVKELLSRHRDQKDR